MKITTTRLKIRFPRKALFDLHAPHPRHRPAADAEYSGGDAAEPEKRCGQVIDRGPWRNWRHYPRNQFVIAQYNLYHNVKKRWVYNRPDIDAEKIVWARDMGDSGNAELVRYFRQRRVWLAEPDLAPPQVVALALAWRSGREAMNIYRVLGIPLVYRMSQVLLAPGNVGIISEHLSRTFAQGPTPAKVLDVGCGPVSLLWNFGMKPVGLDLCHAYTKKFRDGGNLSVTASAAVLPFPAGSFDLVFSSSLLHHLPDAGARDRRGDRQGHSTRWTSSAV